MGPFQQNAALMIWRRCSGSQSGALLRSLRKKVLLREARGTFDVCDSVHRFIAHRETVVAQEHGVGAYGKARADARMMRLQREKLEGNLIPEEDAIEGWTRTLAVLKTQFLALPTKSAPYLVQLKTPAQAQNVLTPLVREILETIATVEILPDPTTGAALPSSSVASRASSGSLCRSAWVVIVPHPTPKPCRLELTLPARLQPRRGRLELPAPDGPTN